MANKLLFDIDAVVQGRAGVTYTSIVLPYTVTVTGDQTTTSGTLIHQGGSDLFGHTGSNYGYYETDKQIQFGAQSRQATITLNLAQVELLSPDGATAPTGSTMVINSYFKFGSTDPVKVPVTFTYHPPTGNH